MMRFSVCLSAFLCILPSVIGGSCSVSDSSNWRSSPSAGRAFTADINTCGRKSLGQAAPTATCLIGKHSGLSRACANCFGANVACAMKQCVSSCMVSPGSAPCLSCMGSKCNPTLSSCTGTPLPPPPASKLLRRLSSSSDSDSFSPSGCYSYSNADALAVRLFFKPEVSQAEFVLFFNLTIGDLEVPKEFNCKNENYVTNSTAISFEAKSDCMKEMRKYFEQIGLSIPQPFVVPIVNGSDLVIELIGNEFPLQKSSDSVCDTPVVTTTVAPAAVSTHKPPSDTTSPNGAGGLIVVGWMSALLCSVAL